MISYVCQMQELPGVARRIREPPARSIPNSVPSPSLPRGAALRWPAALRRSFYAAPIQKCHFNLHLSVAGLIQHHFMNIKRLSVAFAVISFLPLLAHAQAGETNGGSSPPC